MLAQPFWLSGQCLLSFPLFGFPVGFRFSKLGPARIPSQIDGPV